MNEATMSTAVKQRLLFNKLNLPKEVKQVEIFKWIVGESDLSKVKGIGDSTKARLIESWISTIEGLKTYDKEEIGKIITNPLALKNIISFINS